LGQVAYRLETSEGELSHRGRELDVSYIVWCPNRGQTENDGQIVGNNPFATARDAAEQFARTCMDFHSNPFSDVKLYVKEANNHYAPTYECIVTVEAEPVFVSATPRQIK
jgi:hypothetical protein